MALVAEYAFSEAAGSTAADSGPNALTLNGIPGWGAGHTGDGLDVTAGGPRARILFTPQWTVMGWFRFRPTADLAGWRSFFSDAGQSVWIEQNNGTIDFFVDEASGTATTPAVVGEWIHLAVVVDATNTRLFVNGVEEATAGLPDQVTPPQPTFFVGGDTGDAFDGQIDDVRLYDHGLTAAEVVTAMNTPVVAPDSPYVTTIDEHVFRDQHGAPILVKGDSPWALLTRSDEDSISNYLSIRAGQGFNTVLVSLLGALANGAPNADGSTFDGILPLVGGDPATLNEAYFARVDHLLSTAASLGITVMLYPLDGWVTTANYGGFAQGWTDADATAFGEAVGARLAHHRNIVWAVGGDYPDPGITEGSVDDHRFYAVLTGIRNTGDTRPRTIQFTPNGYSFTAYWTDRVDFNFVYAYNETYNKVQEAYGFPNVNGFAPALMSETHYENYVDDFTVTNRYLREQAAWALTSGSPGDFYGSEDVWDADPVEPNLSTPAVAHLSALRSVIEGLRWWELVPDYDGTFITSGRGVKADTFTYVGGTTYVTGGITPDGTQAVVYHPAATTRPIEVDDSRLSGPYTVRWVDPTDGSSETVQPSGTYQKVGANSQGDEDWLLVFEVQPVEPRDLKVLAATPPVSTTTTTEPAKRLYGETEPASGWVTPEPDGTWDTTEPKLL